MQTEDVARAVDACHFKPGWRVFAETLTNQWREPLVKMTVHIDTVNSDQPDAVQGYPENVTLVREAFLDPEEYRTEAQVFERVFQELLMIELHESREFFRVGSMMRAPFHPHRQEGNYAWAKLMGE